MMMFQLYLYSYTSFPISPTLYQCIHYPMPYVIPTIKSEIILINKKKYKILNNQKLMKKNIGNHLFELL